MGLSASLNIARSGLFAHQTALEVTGHNLANVATPGYHRQRVDLAPERAQVLGPGVAVGRGVKIQGIVRSADEVLESRVRNSISDQGGSASSQELLSRIEAIANEFSDTDLSSHLSEFFNAWSELSNRPEDAALRTVVVEQAQSLVSFAREARSQLSDVGVQLGRSLDGAAAGVNDVLSRLTEINEKLGVSRGDPGLLDERDRVLEELAEYVDVAVEEKDNGVVDVYIGSIPIVGNGQAAAIELQRRTVNGEEVVELVAGHDCVLHPHSGKLGAMLSDQGGNLEGAVAALDGVIRHLIFEVNRLHSQGQGQVGLTSVTSDAAVADAGAALNDAAAGLEFTPTHGSFEVHLTSKTSGQRITKTIQIDLDGINPAGDTRLTTLAADLDSVDGLSATVTVDGRLRIEVDNADLEMSFSEDSSGVLAALGINTFFTGSDATDVGVNGAIANDVRYLAAAANHVAGGNETALAIANLRDQGVDGLKGQSVTQYWANHVETYALRLAEANQEGEAGSIVLENLRSQQQAVWGVSTDEEALNLLQSQRAYQGSARFLGVVNEMFDTLLAAI